jgi:cellobiose phosphorylase
LFYPTEQEESTFSLRFRFGVETLAKYKTKYGYFTDDGKEYIITTPRTPRPWINVISNGDYGVIVSQTGSGYSWRTHAQLNRITRWEQDLIKDEWGKYIYIKDSESTKIWSAGWKPVCSEPDSYECRHGIGYSTIRSKNNGIESSLLIFVPFDEPLEIWKLTVRNTSRRKRTLELYTYFEWCLGATPDWHREFGKSFTETSYDAELGALFATKRLWEISAPNGHWNTNWEYLAFHSSSIKPSAYDADKESFIGRYQNQRLPAAVTNGKSGKRIGNWLDPIGHLKLKITLKPGELKEISFTLGAAASRSEATNLIRKYKSTAEVDRALHLVRERWETLLGSFEASTPDDAVNIMFNTWLRYQAIAGRLWGRTAYYQTGGAYGFRDQLQDSQVYLHIDPEETKKQILLHARHQFRNGTVYHWWHPISEVGHPTEMTDDLLWLPFILQSYLDETDDMNILDLKEPFIDDPHPAPLYDHCTRAIDKSLERFSGRGLPLIGAGDWNDGLSAVGLKMKGESVWLGQFLYKVLCDFSEVAGRYGDESKSTIYKERADELIRTLNEIAWDGEWYYRATKDSGEKIGSKENKEGRIYLNTQIWAVIAGVADIDRAQQVMNMVEEQLESEVGPLLLYPAYKTPDEYIGYLTRYSPAMRENGGVYTHAATWAVIAEAMLRRADAAYRMFAKINPIIRGRNPDTYLAEPYVTPGNIEGPESAFYGRGGWTWYSGSAAWLFKVGLEWILGIRPVREGLQIDPCIPAEWRKYTVRRLFRGAVYDITVKNPHRKNFGVKKISINGNPFEFDPESCRIVLPIMPAGSESSIEVILG